MDTYWDLRALTDYAALFPTPDLEHLVKAQAAIETPFDRRRAVSWRGTPSAQELWGELRSVWHAKEGSGPLWRQKAVMLAWLLREEGGWEYLLQVLDHAGELIEVEALPAVRLPWEFKGGIAIPKREAAADIFEGFYTLRVWTLPDSPKHWVGEWKAGPDLEWQHAWRKNLMTYTVYGQNSEV